MVRRDRRPMEGKVESRLATSCGRGGSSLPTRRILAVALLCSLLDLGQGWCDSHLPVSLRASLGMGRGGAVLMLRGGEGAGASREGEGAESKRRSKGVKEKARPRATSKQADMEGEVERDDAVGGADGGGEVDHESTTSSREASAAEERGEEQEEDREGDGAVDEEGDSSGMITVSDGEEEEGKGGSLSSMEDGDDEEDSDRGSKDEGNHVSPLKQTGDWPPPRNPKGPRSPKDKEGSHDADSSSTTSSSSSDSDSSEGDDEDDDDEDGSSSCSSLEPLPEAEPMPSTTVHISNVPRGIGDSDIASWLANGGVAGVVSARLPAKLRRGRIVQRGFAFVTLSSARDVGAALGLNGTCIEFLNETVPLTVSPKRVPDHCDTAFVTSVPPFETTAALLSELDSILGGRGGVVERRPVNSTMAGGGAAVYLRVSDPKKLPALMAAVRRGGGDEKRTILVDYAESLRGDAGVVDRAEREGGSKAAEEEIKTVFMSNLDYAVEEQEIRSFMSDGGCGEVIGIKWGLDERRSAFLGHVHVELSSRQNAENAVALDGRELTGRNVVITWATENFVPAKTVGGAAGVEGGGTLSDVTAYLQNLPWEVTEGDVRGALEGCGAISEVRITRRSGGSGAGTDQAGSGGGLGERGDAVFAHVDFKDSDGLAAALVLGGASGVNIGDALVRVRQAASITRSKPLDGKSFFQSGERPPECDTVFVGNLPFVVTEAEIRELLGECGPVSSIRWGEVEGVFKGFAHVSFSHASSTVKAVAMSGEAMLKCRRIKIDYARENNKGRGTWRDPKESKPPGCTTVWVGNLARGMTSELLAHEFRVCGPVKEAKLVYDKGTGEFRGHAYVSFQDNLASEATDKAVDMSGTVLDGKPLIVQYSAQEWVKPRSCAKNATSGLTVSVSPLPRNITLQDLRDYFEPCGEIESVHWSRRKHTPIPPRLKNSTKSGMTPPPGFNGRAYVQFVYLDGSRAALAMSPSNSRHASVPPWGGDPLTIGPAADAERDKKRIRPETQVPDKVPHWHPKSSYRWRKRAKKATQARKEPVLSGAAIQRMGG